MRPGSGRTASEYKARDGRRGCWQRRARRGLGAGRKDQAQHRGAPDSPRRALRKGNFRGGGRSSPPESSSLPLRPPSTTTPTTTTSIPTAAPTSSSTTATSPPCAPFFPCAGALPLRVQRPGTVGRANNLISSLIRSAGTAPVLSSTAGPLISIHRPLSHTPSSRTPTSPLPPRFSPQHPSRIPALSSTSLTVSPRPPRLSNHATQVHI